MHPLYCVFERRTGSFHPRSNTASLNRVAARRELPDPIVVLYVIASGLGAHVDTFDFPWELELHHRIHASAIAQSTQETEHDCASF